MARTDPRSGFTEFVAARSPALHRAAYLMVGDVALAQDLVQEALVKTYVAWPRLREVGNAEAYTRKAITTTAIGWFRKRAWKAEHSVAAVPEATTPDRSEHLARHDWVWSCLLDLPVRQRAAIVLRYYEDLTEAQTAEAMGCAVGTVKSQVSAGLAKLRDRLGDDAGLLPPDPTEEMVTR